MKRIRSATIDGKRHRIVWRPLVKTDNAWGMAWPDQCLIEIDSSLEDPALIAEVLIHEIMHRQLPHQTEDRIDQLAGEICNALQRAELIAEDEE